MPTFEYAPAPESRAVVDLASSYGLFINGEFVDGSGRSFKTISPATEEVLAQVAEADESDVDAAVKAARALRGDGSFDSSTGFIRQPFVSLMFWACEFLKLSMAQNSGSHRSLSGPAIAAKCAEFTTSTAWNLNPTFGRGWMFRTPASRSAASASGWRLRATIDFTCPDLSYD